MDSQPVRDSLLRDAFGASIPSIVALLLRGGRPVAGRLWFDYSNQPGDIDRWSWQVLLQ